MSSASNPFTPKIPPEVLYYEHVAYAGNAVGDILYGIVIILYFECAVAILNPPPNRRRGGKWGLLGYTTCLFALGTIYTACNLRVRQLSYIDNREFPGEAPSLPPGPIGYTLLSQSKPTSMLSNTSFVVANWMADGLLMYRAFIIYNRQPWVLGLPTLMCLASICVVFILTPTFSPLTSSLAMGIMTLYQTSRPDSSLFSGVTINFGLPYFTISVALNILLTLLIAWRLLLHNRNLKNAIGFPSGIIPVYRTIVTMLIESSALYAAVSICFIVPYAMSHRASAVFLPMLSRVQIIAPLLIIRRVAARRALTGSNVAGGTSANHSAARFKSTDGSGATHDYPPDPIVDSRHGRIGVTATIEFVNDSMDPGALQYDHKV